MSSPGETADRLRTALAALPEDLLAAQVATSTVVSLPANVPPWTRTGVSLRRGQCFSLFGAGRVVLSEEAGLWNGARMHLWARVGGRGPLLNGTQDTASFEAPADGELELCIYSGEWATRDGELATGLEGYGLLQGGIDAAIVVWRGDALEGMRALAAARPEEPLFAAELARVADPVQVPRGWEYLWFLGPADIYSDSRHADGPAIRVQTHDDVGILRRPVELDFGPGTRLRWHWRIDELPSPRAEDSLPTHDYLSVAVEFDNGQDLTYFWSAELAAETCFRCPLPNWDARETHLVVRSGSAGLGEWQAESRDLYADYERAIGTAPARIVAVWLIAVSVFQKRSGKGEFSGIALESGGRSVTVL